MFVYTGLTLSAMGNSAPIVPFNSGGIVVGQLVGQPITSLGLICTVSAGASLTYSVQISGDNPNVLVNWLNHDTLVNLTAGQYGAIIYPVSDVRLQVTAYTSGSVNLGIVQWP